MTSTQANAADGGSVERRQWRVTGSKHGKAVTVVIEAPDRNAAIRTASMARGHCLVVHGCQLITDPEADRAQAIAAYEALCARQAA